MRTSVLIVCRIFYLLIFCSVSGCLTSENLGNTSVEDSTNTRYGWWVGKKGKDAAVDIGFTGNGLQIEVVRSYSKNINSPVGLGWIHNYLMHIRNESDTTLTLFNSDGSELLFTKTEPGIFTCEDEDGLVIQQYGDGKLVLESERGPAFRFNWKGRLMEIEGKQYAHIISLAYGSDGYLDSIRDAQGREIIFNYDPETHRVASIRDESGRFTSYNHNDLGHLISVTNAEGITSEYTYSVNNSLEAVTFH